MLHISRLTMFVVTLLFGMSICQRAMAQYTTDSSFLVGSRPVVFKVNTYILRPDDQKWIIDSLMPQLQAIGPHGVILGRSAASPEGTLKRNHVLAEGRCKAVVDFLVSHGFDASRIHFDVFDEEYPLLVEMLRQKHDPYYEVVRDIVHDGKGDLALIKHNLRMLEGGKVWYRMLQLYYPHLRAVRIMAFDLDPTIPPVSDVELPDVEPPVIIIEVPDSLPIVPLPVDTLSPAPQPLYRREQLSLKTNLLLWAGYVPQYGWCPIPNVAIEYYPAHGHFTYGASFDCPWWIGNTTNHKYFELRNYQLEARYYFRNSDDSYVDSQHTVPAEGKAAFQGWYAQAYLHNFLYQIGFSAKKGWIGEGLGAGLGFGYVMPLSRDQHWRLEFGAQMGYFWTQYDPFVYGKPIYHGGEIDGLYYYNTPLYRYNFVKRQHRYTWIGPTRVGITLSYDLLYRRKHHRSPSFKPREKGDVR